MRRIAFLTMEIPGDFAVYDHLVYQPLSQRGIVVEEVPWSRPNVAWGRFELVVIRWPWDYWHRTDDFLSVLRQIEDAGSVLLNDLATVRWNIHKSYLKDLESRGIATVPTEWHHRPGADELQSAFDRLACDELVVKPVIGAGADGAYRLRRGTTAAELQKVAATFRSTEAMVQPFIQQIVSEGEYSLIYFDNEFSHAILKRPQEGDYRVQEEHGGVITSVVPDVDLREFGQRTLATLPAVPLYSRFDLVRLNDGRPVLMELELIEPSLYFPCDPRSPDRMADAIARRLPT